MCSEAKGGGRSGGTGSLSRDWRVGGGGGVRAGGRLGVCVFMVAHHGVSQHRHVTGTFPAGNKTNVKSLEIKLVKPQRGACLSVSWGGVAGGSLRAPGPGPLVAGATPGAVGCRGVSAHLPGLHPLGDRTSSRDSQECLDVSVVPWRETGGNPDQRSAVGGGPRGSPETGDVPPSGPYRFRQQLGAQSCDRTVPRGSAHVWPVRPLQLFADSQVKLAFLNSSGTKCCLL